jgi:hypothetical protein
MHNDTCYCTECVSSYSATGQTDPFGLCVSVTWSADDQVAHADWRSPSEIYDVTAEMADEMDALAARIEGRRFANAEHLVAYLRRVTGSQDFD